MEEKKKTKITEEGNISNFLDDSGEFKLSVGEDLRKVKSEFQIPRAEELRN